jgi:transposase
MAVEIIPIDRDTPLLLPPCIQDDLPERHLARFVVEIVDPLDWRALVDADRGTGSQPYPPAMLVALLFDGSATGL